VVKRKVVKMITLKDITPVADFAIDCEDSYCDGYGCDIHDSYARKGCDSIGCESTISTHLVEVEGIVSSLCNWHYHELADVA
jgi:hypothetical protein